MCFFFRFRSESVLRWRLIFWFGFGSGFRFGTLLYSGFNVEKTLQSCLYRPGRIASDVLTYYSHTARRVQAIRIYLDKVGQSHKTGREPRQHFLLTRHYFFPVWHILYCFGWKTPATRKMCGSWHFLYLLLYRILVSNVTQQGTLIARGKLDEN